MRMTLKHNWLKGRLLWSAFRFCPDSRVKLPRLPFLLLEPLEGWGVLARASPWRLQRTLRLTLRPITGSPPRQIRFLEGWTGPPRQELHEEREDVFICNFVRAASCLEGRKAPSRGTPQKTSVQKKNFFRFFISFLFL